MYIETSREAKSLEPDADRSISSTATTQRVVVVVVVDQRERGGRASKKPKTVSPEDDRRKNIFLFFSFKVRFKEKNIVTQLQFLAFFYTLKWVRVKISEINISLLERLSILRLFA